MPVFNAELLHAVPAGNAETCLPPVIPRAVERFGPAYATTPITQFILDKGDFIYSDSIPRPIRLTWVRKEAYPAVRETIMDIYPFCLVADCALPFRYLQPESDEAMRVLALNNYLVLPYRISKGKFRFSGLTIPLRRSNSVAAANAWRVIDVFLCGTAWMSFPHHMYFWLEGQCKAAGFLNAVRERQQEIDAVIFNLACNAQEPGL